MDFASALVCGLQVFKNRLIAGEAAPSQIGGRSRLFLLVAASFARASAGSIPGTSLCPCIHC